MATKLTVLRLLAIWPFTGKLKTIYMLYPGLVISIGRLFSKKFEFRNPVTYIESI